MGWMIGGGVVILVAFFGYLAYKLNGDAFPKDEPEWIEEIE